MKSPAELFDLTGKVAVVTGGSRGIGRSVVLGLAAAGADVVVASRKAANCEAVAEEASRYAGSDVLCYFAEGPEGLAARERAEWEPWLDWAEGELGLRLVRVTGVVHQEQPEETLARARALALELDDFRLTGLASAAALFGSAVLAFAVLRGRLSGAAAFGLSRLDEIFQQERWGIDAEAAQRTERMLGEAGMLERWFKALG